jgi:hypothetical protein
MHHTHQEDYIDLYKCGDAALAERAVRILHLEGIEAVCRPVTSDMFPTSVALDSGHVVAVDGSHIDAARRCLQSAAEDGVIPGDAIF